MIHYNYIGNPEASAEVKESANKAFTTFLGPFKKEFEEKDGFVTINLAMEDPSMEKYNLTLGRQYDMDHLVDFMDRLEKWLNEKQSEADKQT